MFDYNTSREPMQLRELGRNIQMLAKYLTTVEDKEIRTRYAEAMVVLMKQVVPAIKDDQESNQRLWDDLHILSEFDLDVDSPFPKPDPETLVSKPDKVVYSTNNIRFRHYGKNVQFMVDEATKLEDDEAKRDAIIHVGKLLKSFHTTWNAEVPDDGLILKNIEILSGGKLTLDIEKIREDNLFDPLYKDKPKPAFRSKKGSKNQNRRRRN